MQTNFDVNDVVLAKGTVLEVQKDETNVFYRVKLNIAGNKVVELTFEEDQLKADV